MTLKYIFLILSIIVILAVFYRQINRGQLHIESMTTTSDNPSPTECENSYKDSKDLPLKEYFVKSSFNSAYDGKNISEANILSIIQEGYRFIDLNVFSASGDVYVGYSPDNAPVTVSDKLLLSTALECINKNAFNPTTKFNPKLKDVHKYPVFVHIRVYRPLNSTVDIISNVVDVVNGKPGTNPPIYSTNYLRNADNKPVHLETCSTLSKIMGKLVFSMDVVNVLQIYSPGVNKVTDVPNTSTKSLQSFVNIVTGGGTMPAFYKYSDPVLTNGRLNKLGISDSAVNGTLKSNVKYMYIVFPHPDDGTTQPDVKHLILNCSVQFIPIRTYLAGSEVDNYNRIFDEVGAPIIPMTNVYTRLINP
jgi:hypothetical protein